MTARRRSGRSGCGLPYTSSASLGAQAGTPCQHLLGVHWAAGAAAADVMYDDTVRVAWLHTRKCRQ
jgi:hypothetical protein